MLSVEGPGLEFEKYRFELVRSLLQSAFSPSMTTGWFGVMTENNVKIGPEKRLTCLGQCHWMGCWLLICGLLCAESNEQLAAAGIENPTQGQPLPTGPMQPTVAGDSGFSGSSGGLPPLSGSRESSSFPTSESGTSGSPAGGATEPQWQDRGTANLSAQGLEAERRRDSTVMNVRPLTPLGSSNGGGSASNMATGAWGEQRPVTSNGGLNNATQGNWQRPPIQGASPLDPRPSNLNQGLNSGGFGQGGSVQGSGLQGSGLGSPGGTQPSARPTLQDTDQGGWRPNPIGTDSGLPSLGLPGMLTRPANESGFSSSATQPWSGTGVQSGISRPGTNFETSQGQGGQNGTGLAGNPATVDGSAAGNLATQVERQSAIGAWDPRIPLDALGIDSSGLPRQARRNIPAITPVTGSDGMRESFVGGQIRPLQERPVSMVESVSAVDNSTLLQQGLTTAGSGGTSASGSETDTSAANGKMGKSIDHFTSLLTVGFFLANLVLGYFLYDSRARYHQLADDLQGRFFRES